MRRKLGVSERRACRVLKQPRTTQRYMPKPAPDERVLTERIIEAGGRVRSLRVSEGHRVVTNGGLVGEPEAGAADSGDARG